MFLSKTQRMILESRRQQMGMTQEEIALLVGITQSGYGHIINDRNGVKAPTLESILKVLGITKKDFDKGDKG